MVGGEVGLLGPSEVLVQLDLRSLLRRVWCVCLVRGFRVLWLLWFPCLLGLLPCGCDWPRVAGAWYRCRDLGRMDGRLDAGPQRCS